MSNPTSDEQPRGDDHVDTNILMEPAPSSASGQGPTGHPEEEDESGESSAGGTSSVSEILELDLDVGGVDTFRDSEGPQKMSLELRALRARLAAMEFQMSRLMGNSSDSSPRMPLEEESNDKDSKNQVQPKRQIDRGDTRSRRSSDIDSSDDISNDNDTGSQTRAHRTYKHGPVEPDDPQEKRRQRSGRAERRAWEEAEDARRQLEAYKQLEARKHLEAQIRKDEAEKKKVLLREIKLFRMKEEKAREINAQRETEARIRKEAEENFMRRMEDLRRAQEEAKNEIEKAKEEAKQAAIERLEAARRAERAAEQAAKERAEAERRLRDAAEQAAKEKFEAEIRAAEERKRQEELDRLREKENAAIMGGETSKAAWREIRASRKDRETKRRRNMIQREEEDKVAEKENREHEEAEKSWQEATGHELYQDQAALPSEDSMAPNAQDLNLEKAYVASKPRILPELNHVEWATFRAIDERVKQDRHAIDVLIGEPVAFKEKELIIATGKPQEKGKHEKTPTEDENIRLTPGKGPLPERIRIRSKLILDLLWQVANPPTLFTKYEPRVLVRPFKILAYRDSQIRMLCEQLENQICIQDHPLPENADSELKEPLSDDGCVSGAASQEAKQHAGCLVEFMDGFLRKKLEYLSSADCLKVAFNDIWYLFKPGDFVIGQGGRQVYRVLSVASTGHKAANAWRNYFDASKTTYDSEETPINILCVNVDFDGKQLGPVSTEFVIKKYDGEKAIESLEVYPANFDRNPSLREQFIKRGKEFLQAAAIQHLHYAGLALETRDEVDSQVVVDFEETFDASVCEGWKPEIEQLVGTTALIPGFETCANDCCTDDFILYDDFVEQERDADFMNTLVPPVWTHSKLPSVAVYPRTLQESRTEENAITEDELLIMSYRVFGFILRSRKWGEYSVQISSTSTYS